MTTRKKSEDTGARKAIQEILVEAQAVLDRAQALADEAGVSFEFLERTYTPKKLTVTTGGWDLDQWESSVC